MPKIAPPAPRRVPPARTYLPHRVAAPQPLGSQDVTLGHKFTHVVGRMCTTRDLNTVGIRMLHEKEVDVAWLTLSEVTTLINALIRHLEEAEEQGV